MADPLKCCGAFYNHSEDCPTVCEHEVELMSSGNVHCQKCSQRWLRNDRAIEAVRKASERGYGQGAADGYQIACDLDKKEEGIPK